MTSSLTMAAGVPGGCGCVAEASTASGLDFFAPPLPLLDGPSRGGGVGILSLVVMFLRTASRAAAQPGVPCNRFNIPSVEGDDVGILWDDCGVDVVVAGVEEVGASVVPAAAFGINALLSLGPPEVPVSVPVPAPVAVACRSGGGLW